MSTTEEALANAVAVLARLRDALEPDDRNRVFSDDPVLAAAGSLRRARQADLAWQIIRGLA